MKQGGKTGLHEIACIANAILSPKQNPPQGICGNGNFRRDIQLFLDLGPSSIPRRIPSHLLVPRNRLVEVAPKIAQPEVAHKRSSMVLEGEACGKRRKPRPAGIV